MATNPNTYPLLPFRWTGVLAGGVVAFACQILFTVLGVTLRVLPNGAISHTNAGIVIWSIASPMAAIFLGGLVAGALTQPFERFSALLAGLTVWGLAMVAGLWLAHGVGAVSALSGNAVGGHSHWPVLVGMGASLFTGIMGGIAGGPLEKSAERRYFVEERRTQYGEGERPSIH